MQARNRNLLARLHRYTGLALALYLVLVGLTGSVIAFREEIDGWLNPQWQKTAPAGAMLLSADELVERIEDGHPGARVSFFYAPQEGQAVAKAFLAPRDEDATLAADQTFIDAMTGEPLGERNFLQTLGIGPREIIPTIYRLHRNLLLDKLGQTITGSLALVWLATLIIGIVLAWPKKGKGWRKAFTVKRGAGTFRTSYDLHRSTGLAAGLLLIVLAISGAVLNLHDIARMVVGTISTLAPPVVSADSSVSRVGWQEAASIAMAAHPEATLFGIAHDNNRNVYQIRLHKPDDIQHSGRLRVFVDAANGVILRSQDPLQSTAGEAFLGLQFPLHSGQIIGIWGQALMVLVGLLPLLFAVTGIVIWLQKRRSEAVNRLRAVKPVRP
jgi:uncharacterized iron-regulated membrane protein